MVAIRYPRAILRRTVHPQGTIPTIGDQLRTTTVQVPCPQALRVQVLHPGTIGLWSNTYHHQAPRLPPEAMGRRRRTTATRHPDHMDCHRHQGHTATLHRQDHMDHQSQHPTATHRTVRHRRLAILVTRAILATHRPMGILTTRPPILVAMAHQAAQGADRLGVAAGATTTRGASTLAGSSLVSRMTTVSVLRGASSVPMVPR